MEPLLKSFRDLGAKLRAIPGAPRLALIAGGLLVIGVIVAAASIGGGNQYEYAYTNLTSEDSTEAAGILKGAGIEFKTEANGSALAVPANKVHEARLMLAAQGLPRGGGVGFELFDRGDFG